jgi:hypothetical protein
MRGIEAYKGRNVIATAPTPSTKPTQTSTPRIRATARTEPGDVRGAAKIERLE